MKNPSLTPGIVLEMRRTIRTSREKAFHAWTDPDQLRQWFAVAEEFTTPIAEVDLRVGGRYRLGMKAPGDSPLLIVGGVYQEILPPQKLVFTWQWESAHPSEPETLVTVEFYEREGVTEVVLRHERFEDALQRNKHGEGWSGCLDHLERLLERQST
jgi:uncharacterized protein YndB with AHSA1/START domain